MRVIPVELDDETVAALEVERELLGFENRSAYIRWIVDNRATIDATDPADRGVLHEAYRERIAQLEERLEEAEATVPDPKVGVDVSANANGSASADADAATARFAGRRNGRDGDGSGPEESEPDANDGWMPSRSDPTVQVRGSPRTTVWKARGGDGDGNESEGEDVAGDDSSESESRSECRDESDGKTDDRAETRNGDSDDDSSAAATDSRKTVAERADGVISSMNLTPERVERIREDPVAEDAGVLGTVEVDRLDELSRRAVAKTRKRLDRDVQTGLEYASSTSLAAGDTDVRPGEDVVDLDELSVPGRSDEVVDRRRELAGHAIAFLRDRGRARRSDFVEALYEVHPAGYDTVDGWWRCVKEALRQVDAIDGGEGARVWTFER